MGDQQTRWGEQTKKRLGFVLRDFSKVFMLTFRLDMADLTLRAVI